MAGPFARKRLPWGAMPLVWLLFGAGLVIPPQFEQVPTINSIIPSVSRGVQIDQLVIPRIDLDAAVVPISMDARGVLTPPQDTKMVGRWDRGSGADATRGQILLTGHTVHTGGGVMDRMKKVKPGTMVTLIAKKTSFRYRAIKNIVLSKKQLAEQAEDLFSQHRHDGRLVLVTCTDFKNGEYLSNIVVLAEPV